MSNNVHYFHPSDNVAPNAVVTSGSSEDASYPLTNVIDLSFKNLANPGGITALTGYFDLWWGGAQDIKAILLWTNFKATLAYRVQTYATNPASLLIDELKAAPAKRADGHTVKIYHDLSAMSGYSATAQHLRINVTGTNDANLRLKLLAFSTIRQTTRNIQLGLSLDEHQTNIEMETEAHHPWAYDLSAPPRLLTAGMVSNETDANAVREWHRACGGGAKLTLVADPSGATGLVEPFLGRFKSGVDITSPSIVISALPTVRDLPNINRQHYVLKEVVSGDPEWT